MAKPTPIPTTLTADEVLARLGVSHRHVLMLVFAGRLEPTSDGGVTVASVEKYERDIKLAAEMTEVR